MCWGGPGPQGGDGEASAVKTGTGFSVSVPFGLQKSPNLRVTNSPKGQEEALLSPVFLLQAEGPQSQPAALAFAPGGWEGRWRDRTRFFLSGGHLWEDWGWFSADPKEAGWPPVGKVSWPFS